MLCFRKLPRNAPKSRFFEFFIKIQLALKIEPDVAWKRYRDRWKAKGWYFRVFDASKLLQVSAHMWHTKGTLSSFVVFCCFLCHMCAHKVCLMCADTFLITPSSKARSELSNAVSQVILRQKLASVVQFEI